MLRAGFETTDPFTETRSVLVQGAEETGGRGWVLDVYCPEGAPPAILEHLHEGWVETFEILQGSAAYRLGREEHRLNAGESVVTPPRVPHVHPWNVGSGVMVYRQTNDFGEADPGAVDDVLGVFATIHGLAREGKIGKRGLPKNPLQFAATLRTLVRHGGYDAAVPMPIQRGMSATMGRLAEALGYRGVYPRYLS
jgi:mannose-6-phosphate isomerase-like protein (cupin superfamily)